jgi:hypothetical protein
MTPQPIPMLIEFGSLKDNEKTPIERSQQQHSAIKKAPAFSMDKSKRKAKKRTPQKGKGSVKRNILLQTKQTTIGKFFGGRSN